MSEQTFFVTGTDTQGGEAIIFLRPYDPYLLRAGFSGLMDPDPRLSAIGVSHPTHFL